MLPGTSQWGSLGPLLDDLLRHLGCLVWCILSILLVVVKDISQMIHAAYCMRSALSFACLLRVSHLSLACLLLVSCLSLACVLLVSGLSFACLLLVSCLSLAGVLLGSCPSLASLLLAFCLFLSFSVSLFLFFSLALFPGLPWSRPRAARPEDHPPARSAVFVHSSQMIFIFLLWLWSLTWTVLVQLLFTCFARECNFLFCAFRSFAEPGLQATASAADLSSIR